MVNDGQFCTFFLDQFFLGVEVGRVQEVIRHQSMTKIPLAPAQIRGLINLRGQIVTAIDLRTQIGLPERPTGELPMNVVVTGEDGAVSLLVDEIDEVVTVGAETFAKPPHNLGKSIRELVRGVHKLKGRLMLILDIDSVMRAAAREREARV